MHTFVHRKKWAVYIANLAFTVLKNMTLIGYLALLFKFQKHTKKKNSNTHLFQQNKDFLCYLIWVKFKLSYIKCLQVPSLIPVLLYKLGRENNPSVVHAVLYCLPSFGTHKVTNSPHVHSTSCKKVPCRRSLFSSTSSLFLIFQLCIPMVLQTLSMLASAPKMSAVAMRLLTALWKIQVCHDTCLYIYNSLYLFCSVIHCHACQRSRLVISPAVPPSSKWYESKWCFVLPGNLTQISQP